MKYSCHPLICFCVMLSCLAIYALFTIDFSSQTGGIDLSKNITINSYARKYDLAVSNPNMVNHTDRQIVINKSYSYPNVAKSTPISYQFSSNSYENKTKIERNFNNNSLISNSTTYNIRHNNSNHNNVAMNNVSFNSLNMLADASAMSVHTHDAPITRLPPVNPEHPGGGNGAPLGDVLYLLLFAFPYIVFKSLIKK